MEWDVVNNARLAIRDLKVEGDSVIVTVSEKNEGWRLLAIEQPPFTATYEFRGRLFEKARLEFTSESAGLLEKKFRPFAEWAGKEHPQEYSKMAAAGYSAEGARLYLFLAKEWRDKISTEWVSTEQELIKLENEWAEALVKHDWAFLDRILADGYVVTDPEGSVSTKAQEMAFLKSGEFAVTSCVHHELKVCVYGDAAVVTGHTTTKETYKGKDFINNLRWTDTWVKSAGRWQCVAGHSSEIAQK
jgi:ketosteroid isomerase-like protein